MSKKCFCNVVLLIWILHGTPFNLEAQQSPWQAGKAAGNRVSLLGQAPVNTTQTADIWGFQDATTGKEYAIVGYGYFSTPPNAGVMIFDVSDPSNPTKVSDIAEMPGFDVKTWKNYAYGVTGTATGELGRIADISDVTKPQIVGSMPTAHNLFISGNGYMILAYPGIRIYDLNINPASPALVWSDNLGGGHDAAVIGSRLYDFHGGAGTFIYDFSNPTAPQLLNKIVDPAIQYHHSGWVTEDEKYLFICDELARHPTPDITVWDISDVENPLKVASIAEPGATIHNLQIVKNYAFISHYTAGFRILDITDPTDPAVIETYDTSPASGEGYDGAFGVFTFTASKNIYISDGQQGLFVFSFDGLATDAGNDIGPPAEYALSDNYPNPFNPETIIRYSLPEPGQVQLAVFNLLGQPVRTLVERDQSAGVYSVTWHGLDDALRQVPSGLYFYTLKTNAFSETKRMLLIR